jgi:hypothetical protein
MIVARESRDAAQGGPVGPEEVLLQITLGFMVVLGYLLSDEVGGRGDLGQRLERAEAIYAELQSASKNELVEQVTQARNAEERALLLNAWLRTRAERLLYRRVEVFDESGGMLAALPADKPASDPSFRQLRDEVDRLFRPGRQVEERQNALAEEITVCTLKSIELAGYRSPPSGVPVPQWVAGTKAWVALDALDRHAQAARKVVSPENLRFLISQIHTDFEGQRRKVGRIQLALVMRLAEARLAQGVLQGASGEVREVLVQLLNELDEEVRMLPEVRSQLASPR